MRIKENGISFRNEVNIINPIEMFIWLFGGDYVKGYRFKVDGIKISSYLGFYNLNTFQLKKVKVFYEKYKDSLPIGFNRLVMSELGLLNESK